MNTALLHYWLTNWRGGEKVLAALAEMFPKADVFTHALAPTMRDTPQTAAWKGHAVHESFIARLPHARVKPQIYLPLMPHATRRFDLAPYDLVLSSESGPIKGIRKRPGQRHICYCHTPMRYVWDMQRDYYRATGLCGKLALKLFTPYLRHADLKSAECVDNFVANSAFVAARIRRIYGRESTVVHPPVDVAFFSAPCAKSSVPCAEDGSYYLLAGALVPYKQPALALRACVRMNRKILVVGTGPMQATLQKEFAGSSNVRFLGRRSDDELRALYAGARALLFPGAEDFGIVPVEAQAAGTPVIAFNAGGALETVLPGKTGLFFPEQNVDSLCAALAEFEALTWSKAACVRQAAQFSQERFTRSMRAILAQAGFSDLS